MSGPLSFTGETFPVYIRWYAEGDVDGAAEVCVVPFVVVRDGVEIRLPDHDAMREHLAAVMEGFRTSGVARWGRIETDLNELGDRTIFATVRCMDSMRRTN